MLVELEVDGRDDVGGVVHPHERFDAARLPSVVPAPDGVAVPPVRNILAVEAQTALHRLDAPRLLGLEHDVLKVG